MTYVDDDYARFIDAFDPQPEADPWAGWRAVAVVAAVCAVALAVVGLGRTALDDVGIAGASSPQSFAAWYQESEANRFHYWYASDERNAGYYHVREHFGTGRLGDEAVEVSLCESNLEPDALNRSSGASGLFQLLGRYHAERFQQVTGLPFYDGRFNPDANAQYAADLYRRAGWQPWLASEGCWG